MKYCGPCDSNYEGDKCPRCVGITLNEQGIQNMSVEEISKFVGASSSVIAKKIWNAAIEAAALKAKEAGAFPNVLLKIMRLKK